jgi:hypothetical protein
MNSLRFNMNKKEKDELFDAFLEVWGDRLEAFISKENISLELKDEIYKRQKEWVSQVSQLDSEIDREFFKPYWIPTKKDSVDFFIDPSQQDQFVFEAFYMWSEPYEWYKTIPNSVHYPELDDNVVITKTKDDILTFHEANKLHSSRRLKLGMAGMIKLNEKEPYEYFDKKADFLVQRNDRAIMIEGVQPAVLELIPNNIEIEVLSLNGIDEYEFLIRDVHALCFLFQEKSFDITSLFFELKPPYSGKVIFEKNVLCFENVGFGIGEITEGKILDVKEKYDENMINNPSLQYESRIKLDDVQDWDFNPF